MFESLTDRFSDAFRRLSGRGRISEANIREAVGQVRTALLEADVNYQVVKDFCQSCVQEALGAEVVKSLHPGQVMVKVVHDQLVKLMGPTDPRIPYVTPPPTVVMLAGLQGGGKTTTVAKLSRLVRSQGHRPMMVAADLQRPAAIHQLEVLGGQLKIPVFADHDNKNAVRVARQGLREAEKNDCDVVILDTAGRLHVDEAMMAELKRVAETVQPHQIYLVCDAMTGQDAVNSAKEFNELLELDGVILTKLDGDARGGAALSVKAVTGKPIKFVGLGEKLEQLEPFHPDRMAGRILGMGDVVSLVEKAQEQVSQEQAEQLQAKMAKGDITLEDFLSQMQAMRRMGPLKEIMKMIPGLGSQMKHVQMDDGEIKRMQAVIHSMTPAERSDPDLVDGSRRRRIARGSGTEPQDVSGLIKGFDQAKGLMKQMAGMGMGQRMNMAKQLSGMDLLGGGLPKVRKRSTRKKLDRKAKKKLRKRGRR